eukprot:7201638-Prymnesium_polylepis.1
MQSARAPPTPGAVKCTPFVRPPQPRVPSNAHHSCAPPNPGTRQMHKSRSGTMSYISAHLRVRSNTSQRAR